MIPLPILLTGFGLGLFLSLGCLMNWKKRRDLRLARLRRGLRDAAGPEVS